jgi:hypothetical protein
MRTARSLVQFIVFIMMEGQVRQFDLDRLTYRQFPHLSGLKHPLVLLQPAITELIPAKTLLRFHFSDLDIGDFLIPVWQICF